MTPHVLHVVEAIESGVARHVTDLVGHVDARHTVVAPANRSEGVTDLRALEQMRAGGADVVTVGMRRSATAPANGAALVRIARLVAQLRPDVVHGHSGIGGALARLVPARHAARVYTPNGIGRSAAVIAAERVLGVRTDAFVCVSPTERDFVVEHRLVPPQRLRVIPNGIARDWTPRPGVLRSAVGIARGVPLVGMVARLVPQKAPVRFVDMAAIVHARRSDAHFVIVGDGRLRGEVERAARASPASTSIHVVGYVADVAESLGDLDVFVLPSDFEGAPYAALEAMRAGVACVLTDVVGNRDTVVDGESGRLVPPAPDSLAAAVVELLDDGELRARAAAAGQRRAAEAFDLATMARSYGELYRELATRG